MITYITLLFIITYLTIKSWSINVAPIPTEINFFSQKLDHFDASNTTHFNQKYIIYDGYYKEEKNSPIFFILVMKVIF